MAWAPGFLELSVLYSGIKLLKAGELQRILPVPVNFQQSSALRAEISKHQSRGRLYEGIERDGSNYDRDCRD